MSFLETILLVMTVVLIGVVILCIILQMHIYNLKQKITQLGYQYQNLNVGMNNISAEQKEVAFALHLLEKEEEKNFIKHPIIESGKKIEVKNLFKGKRVLIGDYNLEMLKHTKKIFMSLGFDVDIVSSGEEIINKIENGYSCDVIVTNHIYKDGCDGEEVLHTIKNKGISIPVVVLTISIGKRNQFVYENGFDGYLEKMLTQKQAEEEMKRVLFANKDKK